MVSRIDRGDVVLVTARDIGGLYRDPTSVFRLEAALEGEDDRPEFPCFMITEMTLRCVGWFDEAYQGAYFEDNDYHARIVCAGYRGVRLLNVPVFHYGCATVRTDQEVSSEINQKADVNREYFRRKWGCLPKNTLEEMRSEYFGTAFDERLSERPVDARVSDLYHKALEAPYAQSGHLEALYRLGSAVSRITELSTGDARSTCALVHARPRSLTVYRAYSPHFLLVQAAAAMASLSLEWHPGSEFPSEIEETDMLLLDAGRGEPGMLENLHAHASKVGRYICLRDVASGVEGPNGLGHREKWRGISDYVRKNPSWRLAALTPPSPGLVVLERYGD
jgi:hypothetical protein